MTTFENHEVAINLELLKRLRFYRVLDPNGTKRFGRNVYWLGFLVANVIFRCLLVFTRDSGTFREHGRRSGRGQFFLHFFFILHGFAVAWLRPFKRTISPLISYLARVPENANVRLWNILNLRFPVNIEFFNRNFIGFYTLELFVILSYTLCPMIIIFDTCFISFCRVIVAQYTIITRAFATVGFDVNSQLG